MQGRCTMTRTYLALVSAALLLLLVGCTSEEGGKAVMIRHAKITLMQAAAKAEKEVPGSQAVNAELIRNNSGILYEIEC